MLSQAKPPMVEVFIAPSGKLSTRTDGKAYDRILISEAIARGVAGQVIILDGEKSES